MEVDFKEEDLPMINGQLYTGKEPQCMVDLSFFLGGSHLMACYYGGLVPITCSQVTKV